VTELLLSPPRGVHHVGMTVRSLDRSLAWWKEMFGIEPAIEVRSSEPLDVRIQRAIGVAGAFLSYAFLPVGESMIELLEYHDPIGRDFSLSNSDIGAMHVALRIDDVQAQYDHMVAHGASFLHPPIALEGELAGIVFAYATDPDGLQVELWQQP
jgi:catechol 2,3-dioxygenase-like lactoylglutathione lyase family enzyme